jgi:hypothetical protein
MMIEGERLRGGPEAEDFERDVIAEFNRRQAWKRTQR